MKANPENVNIQLDLESLRSRPTMPKNFPGTGLMDGPLQVLVAIVTYNVRNTTHQSLK